MSKTALYFSFFALILTITTNAYAEHLRYEAISDSGIVYELIVESENPEVLKPLPVKINVSDQNGKSMTGSQITCLLTMPAMAMPTNKPPLKATGVDGQYSGIFVLTMGGLWHVELEATYSSGEKEAVVIPIPGVVSENDSEVETKLEDLFHENKKSN